MSHNHQKKIAVINDLSGFGRCSIAVALPLISHLGIQCCPLPTAIFSDHTGFESFYVKDFTDSMAPYMAEWKKLDLEFEGILTGFLGSARQIELVEQFLKEFTTQRTTVIVDPVMGDYGKLYATYTQELCQGIGRLVQYADILTPNVTEAWHPDRHPISGAFYRGGAADIGAEALRPGTGQGGNHRSIPGLVPGKLLLTSGTMDPRYSGHCGLHPSARVPAMCFPRLWQQARFMAYPLPKAFGRLPDLSAPA